MTSDTPRPYNSYVQNGSGMIRVANGDWVKDEDYRTLEQENRKLREALQELYDIINMEYPNASVDKYWPTIAPSIEKARTALQSEVEK